MTTSTGPAAVRAIEGVLELLADAGIDATRDAGAFYPQPAGVLVGLPALTARGLASSTFEVSVLVVSGDPLNTELAVDRVYALAEDVAFALRTDNYRPSSWRSSSNAEPLPALELLVGVGVSDLVVEPLAPERSEPHTWTRDLVAVDQSATQEEVP